MKRILTINTVFDRGGAARVAREIFEGLQSDFDMQFAFGRGTASGGGVHQFGAALGHYAAAAAVRLLAKDRGFNRNATQALIQFIQSQSFDLIHVHNLHGYYLDYGVLTQFLGKLGLPVVWTLHDEWALSWLPAYTMGCRHCKTGEGACTNTYPYPKTYWRRAIAEKLAQKQAVLSQNWAPTIVSPAQWLADDVSASYLGRNPVSVIANGVDTDLFKPRDKMGLRAQLGLPQDQQIVLFLSVNFDEKRKGGYVILPVAKAFETDAVQIVTVGQGGRMDAPNVRALGYVTPDKLARVMAAVDVLCFPSEMEVCPLTSLEAMACGVPVVGFDIPAMQEQIDSEVGALVPLGDVEALIQILKMLLGDLDGRAEKSVAARRRVETRFSRKAMVSGYKSLYERLLDKAAAPSIR